MKKAFVSIPNNLLCESGAEKTRADLCKALGLILGEEIKAINGFCSHDYFDWCTNEDETASCLRYLSASLCLLSNADLMLLVTGDHMEHDHITESEVSCARRYGIPIVTINVEGLIPDLVMN